MKSVCLLSVILLVSCSQGSVEDSRGPAAEETGQADDTQIEDDATSPTGECMTLDVEDCVERSDCVPIEGKKLRTLSNGDWCVDYSVQDEPKGCMSADVGCLAVISFASPPTNPGTCFSFPSSCIPTDWGNCSVPLIEECQ